jgi:hypothetical protein
MKKNMRKKIGIASIKELMNKRSAADKPFTAVTDMQSV